MQLPIYLDLEPKDLWNQPYLQPCEKIKSSWNLTSGKKKVGVRWRGSKHYEQDLRRSYPLKELHSVLKDFDYDFLSLQKDDGVEETSDFPGLIDLSDKFESIEDTFALISNLDFVITSCTSIAHMAASQGKKVFVFVPISTYYIWCHPTEKSPWYGEDNVYILRQQKPHTGQSQCKNLKNYWKLMDRIFFLSGLPRSGSTLLGSIMGQNPDFTVTPTSPFLDLLCFTNQAFDAIDQKYTYNKEKITDNVYRGIVSSYYKHIETKYVLDKHRGHPKNIVPIKKYIDPDPKIICVVRPIAEVICSYIQLIGKNGQENNFIDNNLRSKKIPINTTNRAKCLWDEYIQDPYASMSHGI
jgi:hypothetical protein